MKYNKKKDSYEFDSKPVDFFINIGLITTSRCNLKCIQCCEDFNKNEGSLENIKKSVDQLAKNGLKKICVTGGEPLLRKDLKEIVKYIHKKGILITFSTNSSLINRKKLLELKPYIDNMRVTLYGNEEIHDKITQIKGSFKKVIENLENARELNIPVSVITTLMKQNVGEIENLANICKKYSIKKLYIFSLIPTGRGKLIFKKEYFDYKKIGKVVKKLEKKLKLQIKVIDWEVEGQCVLLYSNGDIVAQPSFSDKGNKKIVGNLLKESASSIWKKYPFKENHINYYKDLH